MRQVILTHNIAPLFRGSVRFILFNQSPIIYIVTACATEKPDPQNPPEKRKPYIAHIKINSNDKFCIHFISYDQALY